MSSPESSTEWGYKQVGQGQIPHLKTKLQNFNFGEKRRDGGRVVFGNMDPYQSQWKWGQCRNSSTQELFLLLISEEEVLWEHYSYCISSMHNFGSTHTPVPATGSPHLSVLHSPFRLCILYRAVHISGGSQALCPTNLYKSGHPSTTTLRYLCSGNQVDNFPPGLWGMLNDPIP